MNNNPVKYTDPTGHDPKGPGYCYEPDDPGCGGSKKQPPKPPIPPITDAIVFYLNGLGGSKNMGDILKIV
jgi:hypothetical protein